MLGFPVDTRSASKVSIVHGAVGHLDPKQSPAKRKPFSAILNQHFIHRAELILPEELYDAIKDALFRSVGTPTYCKVILPLKSLLEGDFFNDYIKKGNILMLSVGKFGIDNVFTLREGMLSLYLDRESYERAGLVGKPYGVKGKRGMKPRWVVEINLRLPSMLHGKKGFDRINHAFKHVLTNPVAWLFCNFHGKTPQPDPLDQHFPKKVTCTPRLVRGIKATVPNFRPAMKTYDKQSGGDFEDMSTDIHEWLSLISLGSPRVDPDDQIDSYLSRYASPAGEGIRINLVKITWHGLLSSSWAHNTYVQAMSSAPRDAWFAFLVGRFNEAWPEDTRHCTILNIPDGAGEFMLWEPA